MYVKNRSSVNSLSSSVEVEKLSPAEILVSLRTSMLRYIRSEGFDPPEDIYQDVAHEVVATKDFSQVKNLRAYLFQMVKNHVKKAHKKRYKRLDRIVSNTAYQLAEQTESLVDMGPEERKIKGEKDFIIAMTLNIIDEKLPPNQAKVIKMSFLQGMTDEEISRAMDMKVPNVRQLKSRGVRKLRELLN